MGILTSSLSREGNENGCVSVCVCVGRDENKKPPSVIMRRIERIRIERTVEMWRRDMKVNEMVEDEKLRG